MAVTRRLDLAGELEADDAGDQHRHRLAEHRSLGLDAADAPAEYAQSVHHRGVRVGAHTGIGVGHSVAGHHHARQVFDVDLVHDAGAGRHHLEVVEGALTPAQELVALTVALVFDLDVALERVGRAEQVRDHRVVDHQVGRGQRVDLLRVAAQIADGLPHGGEVDDAGNAGEVLHDDACGRVLDFDARLGLGIPLGDRLDVVLGDVAAVFVAQQVLGEDFQAVGKLLGSRYRVQPVDLVTVPADLQGVVGSE